MISWQDSVSVKTPNADDIVCRIEIIKWSDGSGIVSEALNHKSHGKETYYSSSSIENRIFCNDSWIAEKEVKQDEAYYSKTGTIMRANDAEWKSLTELIEGK